MCCSCVGICICVCSACVCVCMCVSECVCVSERGGVVHLHCANFSNLNRQFQSIATAYRFRHEFYFFSTFGCATDAMLAHFRKRNGEVESGVKWRGDREISNTLKVVWIHLPESIITQPNWTEQNRHESQAINLINTCVSHPFHFPPLVHSHTLPVPFAALCNNLWNM